VSRHGLCNARNLKGTTMHDLTYEPRGLYLSLMPHTPDGENAFRTIVDATGGDMPLAIHLPQLKYALRQAGYTMRKGHPKVRMSRNEIDALAAELGV
jgi:hypothetical protein